VRDLANHRAFFDCVLLEEKRVYPHVRLLSCENLMRHMEMMEMQNEINRNKHRFFHEGA